jgi:membrane protease YdiL (CAAX protease family)
MDNLFFIIGFSLVCLIIILANLRERQKASDALLNGSLFFLAALIAFVGMTSLLGAVSPMPNMPQIELTTALIFTSIAIFSALFCVALIRSLSFRQFLQNRLIRSDGKNRLYNAHSPVHTTAIVLMVFFLINTIGNFIIGGGVSGMAQSLQQSSMGLRDLLMNFLIFLLVAFLGIGMAIRRDLWQSLQRLGLLLPKDGLGKIIHHLLIGAMLGFGLFWLQIILTSIWQTLVSPETLAEQTAASEQIFAAFKDSLWLGLLLAVTTAFGEELLFRGALQPIFGNLLVSLFFMLIHSQYILTPASLIILIVSLVFGYLRQNYSTSAAIAAHFIYNFTPFALLYLANQAGISP